MKVNKNYQNLKESYLFSTVARKAAEFSEKNPGAKIIKLSIGDVTMPLCPSAIEAMHKAVDDMATKENFHGYAPEQGYPFLKEAIKKYYAKRNVELDVDEIFISDGAKSDVANILDLFDKDNVVVVPDPVYPVYVDTNIMHGRKIEFVKGTFENNFLPLPDESIDADIIYICSPNNPTGGVYDKAGLKAWVDYALKHDAVILFDSAYEAFIKDESLPRSIYEIEGAKKCAIEIGSLSKTAGFTGTRCGYTVVPSSLEFDGASLNKMWLRRQTTKFNGTAYIIQKGAEAVFSDKGMEECHKTIDYYMENAKIMSDAFKELGIEFIGGINSPYIWLKCPNNMGSWEFFDYLLENAHVVGTPGAGFGECGEGYLRLTAFNNHENTIEAIERIKKLLSK